MKFDVNAYETVDARTRRFYGDYPEGRISTELIAFEGGVGDTRWVVKASVFRGADDVLPAGTGHAFEVDGTGMANKTSALENCETSAVGRALASAGYSGDLKATREEMMKAKAGEVRGRVAAAKTEQDLNTIYSELHAEGIEKPFLSLLSDRKKELNG